MNDKQLQKLLRLSDAQVEDLRWQNGDHIVCSDSTHRQCPGHPQPSTASLLELVRITVTDAVGERTA